MRDETENRGRATLLVAHTTDVDARAILDEASRQVALGNANAHLRVVVGEDTPQDAALWSAELVDGSESPRVVSLFTYLGGLGTLEMFRYVAVCTTSNNAAVAEDLDHRMRDLREKTAFMLGGERPRTQARIGIIGYGDQQVDRRFYSALADANLVVIPLDRLEDASFARPVERREQDVFRAHGAVELLSATGLWCTMQDAPIDHLRVGAGGGETRVRFIQARMRLLRTPAIPVGSLMAEDRDLPIPEGYQPGPNVPSRLARSGGLLPPELHYEPSEPPIATRVDVDAKSLALLFGRELLIALIDLPRLIWRAAGGEVAALTRSALQEAVGRESLLRVRGSSDESIDTPEAELQSRRRELERKIDAIINDEDITARLDPIPGEVWTSLVGETLGLVDGDPECAGLRADLFGDELYLPVERRHLLAGVERLPVGVVMLAGGVSPESEASAPPKTEAEAPIDPVNEVVELVPAPSSPSTPVPMDGPVATAILQDGHRLDLIRAAWQSIGIRAGSEKKGVDVVMQHAFPYDLSGGVLTIRFQAKRAKYTARRAADSEASSALLDAIRKELGGGPSSVKTLIEGEESAWDRAVRVDELALMFGLDVQRTVGDLKKFGISGIKPETVITAAQIRGFVEDGRSKGLKLFEALTDLGEHLFGAVFGYGAMPIDRLSTLVAAPVEGEGGSSEFQVSPAATPVEKVDERPEDGLLVRLTSAIGQQRAVAAQDIQRLLGMLRRESEGETQSSLARSVPIGGGLGVVLLLFRLGFSDRFIEMVQDRSWTAYQLDLWFTVSTMIILALALSLTDFGKQLGGQTRIMIFGAGTLASLATTVLFFDSLRTLVSGPLRESRAFAVALGVLTVAFVIFAAYQSWISGSPLRIQGSRVLGFMVLVYAVVGVILHQTQAGSWVDTRSEDFARRFNLVLLAVGLALVVIALAIITVIRVRDSRRRNAGDGQEEWALNALADAVEMRELLALGERQWLVTLAALSQLIRYPFGPLPTMQEVSSAAEAPVLKSASVQLSLSARGEADLEARVRQELIRPSWLRLQYENLVRAHRELIATRAGVPATTLEDRRPECDFAVPTESELASGNGRGDRFEFAQLLTAGAFDEVRQEPIFGLEVEKIFQPMLADREVQSLEGFGGHASTVRDFFAQVVPQSEPKIPDGVVRKALAANEQARSMRAFIWWPESMLGELVVPDDFNVDRFSTALFRRGAVGGAGLVSVRVDVSGEFGYSELVGAVDAPSGDAGVVAEVANDYDGASGL
jgi:hypothetical protein